MFWLPYGRCIWMHLLANEFSICANNQKQNKNKSRLNRNKNNSKKSLLILEDGASGVQVGDIEQVNV